MKLIYLVFVWPIQQLLGLFFGLYHGMTGDYGLSLLLMSLTVSLLTAPLYYLAEGWRAADEGARAAMAPELASVRRHYVGQKRFYLTRHVHRLHGYSGLSSLRASLGVLFQIPFFFGAYELLSGHAGLRGQSFLFLGDLGRPDGLLGGLNLLPFVMTAINLASSLVYSRSLRWKDNASSLILALAFLVLLYGSPSALLLYWTSNNALSLLKNLLFPAPRHRSEEGAVAAQPSLRGVLDRLAALWEGELAKPLSFLALLAIVLGQAWWLVARIESFSLCVELTTAVALGLSALALAKGLGRRPLRGSLGRLAPVLLSWLLFLPVAYLLFFFRRQNPWISNENIKLIGVLVPDLAGFLALRAALAPSAAAPRLSAPGRGELVLFVFAATSLAAIVAYLDPLRIYFSAPADVGMGPGLLLAQNSPLVAAVALGSLALGLLLRALRRPLPLGALAALGLMGAAFSLLGSGRYGVLDEFSLERAESLDRVQALLWLLDAAIVYGAYLLGRAAARRRPALIGWGFAALLALGLAEDISALRSTPSDQALAAPPSSGASLPAGTAEAHTFSATGPNLVYIVADMFNGNYLGRALAEDPSLARSLSGFVWYPETVSVGSHTAVSLPALYGGPAFAPDRAMAKGESGRALLDEATARFFGGLRDKGYSTATVDALYSDPAAYGALSLHAADYVGAWRARSGGGAASAAPANPKARLLAMLSVFNQTPTFLKARIYDRGSWVIFRRSFQFDYIANKTALTYGYLDLLPEISRVGGPGRHLLFIHSQFPHEPFGVRADGSIIRGDFPDPATRSFVDKRSAYLTARQFLRFLAAWTDWMRSAGVYDSSTIVVVADHGNDTQDNGYSFPPALDNFADRARLSRVRPLLLVKRAGSRGELREDRRPMSNAEAPAILLADAGVDEGLGPDPAAPGAPPRPSLRFEHLEGTWKGFLEGSDMNFTSFVVRGSPEDPGAWSRQ